MADIWASIILLNYNGKAWLPRCLESLRQQTLLPQLEIIVADNASTDGSDQLAATLLAKWPTRTAVIQNGGNLGYCEGNNRGAAAAHGQYLLFLNTDTWLEPDCLEKLKSAVQAANADAASPLILNYEDDSFQGSGATGFDIFGYVTDRRVPLPAGEIFCPPGCAYLIRTELFRRLGGFDPEFFMYADESDLSWRAALAGGKAITVPPARLHHRGAVAANPKGGDKVVEFRTNEMVRFFATRNALLLLLKNARNLLLVMAVFQLALVLAEALAVLILTRRWSAVRKSYLRALADVWRLRHHVWRERQRFRSLRRHGDLWMLRFLRPRPARWLEVQRALRLGPPKLNPAKF